MKSLGNRMKENYESPFLTRLPLRLPVIIRLDGKAFHTLLNKAQKPYDLGFTTHMQEVARRLCEKLQGVELAYIQSDEISLLLHNYKKFDSQPWFGNEIQKIVSVSAGYASAALTVFMGREAIFDARVFVLPEDEVNNYFLWRQQDAERNSLQMLAQSLYSHKDLLGQDSQKLHDLIHAKNLNWNDVEDHLKRGSCVVRSEFYNNWEIDLHIPRFNQAPQYIEQHLIKEEG
ncbi:MAG: hypothetical protein KCHDKBKB_00643 [Elusimicrobia bacterium]|nr:hypothetical protein [Elusimicrobiota bacterium]